MGMLALMRMDSLILPSMAEVGFLTESSGELNFDRIFRVWEMFRCA